jgi:hypothetical protein
MALSVIILLYMHRTDVCRWVCRNFAEGILRKGGADFLRSLPRCNRKLLFGVRLPTSAMKQHGDLKRAL